MPQLVSIACEGGGPETRAVCQAKVSLAQALERTVTSTYSQAVSQYALVLRVSGSIQTYGEEGLARLRFYKSRRYITVDIQIPERAWKPLSASELREYIARQVLSAVEACSARLERESLVQREPLLSAVRNGIAQYLGSNSDA